MESYEVTWRDFLRLSLTEESKMKKNVYVILFLSKKPKRKPYIMHKCISFYKYNFKNYRKILGLEHGLSEEIWGDICVREGRIIPRGKEEKKKDHIWKLCDRFWEGSSGSISIIFSVFKNLHITTVEQSAKPKHV